jgi:hypothetical protein
MIRFPVRNVGLEQNDVLVDCLIQSQFAHELVHGPDAAAANRSQSRRYLAVDVGIFEHGVGLIRILLPRQSGFEILLVSKVDFVVSFVQLECAPFGYVGYLQTPITTNNDAHSRVVSPFLAKNHAGSGISPTRTKSFSRGSQSAF